MILKSFGCSFIYGTDLADDGLAMIKSKPSKLTWPSLIAQSLNYEYQCYARPGIGNLRISEQVLSQAYCEPSLFVVGWTWIDRFDYTSDSNQWQTIVPVDSTVQAEAYYKHLHSQYRDKFTTLSAIKLTIDTLRQNGHRFIMTGIDDLTFETEWHTTPAVMALQDYIRPYISTFDNQSFLEWSRAKRFEISSGFHPLEPAHRAAASLMLDNIGSYIKV